MAGTKITMSLSEKTFETLKQLAEAKGMKKSAIVALALAEFAEGRKEKCMRANKKSCTPPTKDRCSLFLDNYVQRL